MSGWQWGTRHIAGCRVLPLRWPCPSDFSCLSYLSLSSSVHKIIVSSHPMFCLLWSVIHDSFIYKCLSMTQRQGPVSTHLHFFMNFWWHLDQSPHENALTTPRPLHLAVLSVLIASHLPSVEEAGSPNRKVHSKWNFWILQWTSVCNRPKCKFQKFEEKTSTVKRNF